MFNGNISVNFGNDTGTVDFSNLNGTFVTVGTERIALSWNAATHVLTGTVAHFAADLTTVQARDGSPLFTVDLAPGGAYTVTLLDNVLHAPGGNETSTAVDLFYHAADSDGDSTNTGKLIVTFNDDTPAARTGAIGSLTGAQPAVNGSLNLHMGADGLGNLVFDFGGNGTGTLNNGIELKDALGHNLTVGGAKLYLFGDNTGTAYATIDPAGGGAHALEIILNPNGTWTLDVNDVISNGTASNFNDFSQAKAGNVDFRGIGADVGGTGETDALISGHNEQLTQGTVNTNSTSIGVDSQAINPGNGIRIDFVTNLSANASVGAASNRPAGVRTGLSSSRTA